MVAAVDGRAIEQSVLALYQGSVQGIRPRASAKAVELVHVYVLRQNRAGQRENQNGANQNQVTHEASPFALWRIVRQVHRKSMLPGEGRQYAGFCTLDLRGKPISRCSQKMAERVGFEPTIPVKVCPLSRRIVSTAHAPLRKAVASRQLPVNQLATIFKERLQEFGAAACQDSAADFYFVIQLRANQHLQYRLRCARVWVVPPRNSALD